MVVRLLKRLVGLCLAVLLLGTSGYVFFVGLGRLALWYGAQQPNQYAVAYPYLADAVPWMALGLFGLVGSLAVITSGQRSLRWLWFPALTLLYCILVVFQPRYGWFVHHAHHPMSTLPIAWAQDLSRWDFMQLTADLTKKASSRGAFSCPGNDVKAPSRFMSGGQILMYEVQCAAAVLGKVPNPPTRPAIIFMSVSEDRVEAEFRVTTLVHTTGELVTWLSNYGGVDFVIHESIKDHIWR